MTAQISDSVRYEGREYSLAGVNGEGLFDPTAHGLQPVATSTANWRGFWCLYEVREGRLELCTLHVGLQGTPPPLFGVKSNEARPYGETVYEDLHAKVAFTGGILVGDDFIREMYVHMGFHPAYKFRVVHELLFEEGRLTSATDQTSVMEKIREGMEGQPLEPGRGASTAEIEQWIEGTFSLKYW